MPHDRFYLSATNRSGFFHCVSRLVDRHPPMGETEREHLVSLLREYESFCEVRVLTFCVMSDHFHLLLEVPKRPRTLPSAEEVLAKVRRLTGHQNVAAVAAKLEGFRRRGDLEGERQYLETFHCRMWSLDGFMKPVKQRFTQYINRLKCRRGALWDSRFRSVVVEPEGVAPAIMAGYLDLNPVRAGLVKDPQEYRWCGYGAAMAGERRAREGLRTVMMAIQPGVDLKARVALELYRDQILNGALTPPPNAAAPQRRKMGRPRAWADLPLADFLRCRVRYFSDGAVFGTRAFVEAWFEQNRDQVSAQRKTGARPIRGLAGMELCTLRDLTLDVFGHAGGRKGRVPPRLA